MKLPLATLAILPFLASTFALHVTEKCQLFDEKNPQGIHWGVGHDILGDHVEGIYAGSGDSFNFYGIDYNFVAMMSGSTQEVILEITTKSNTIRQFKFNFLDHNRNVLQSFTNRPNRRCNVMVGLDRANVRFINVQPRLYNH